MSLANIIVVRYAPWGGDGDDLSRGHNLPLRSDPGWLNSDINDKQIDKFQFIPSIRTTL